MNCEIIPINENSWRIEDSGVRCFLLTGSEKALLIDSGRELHTVFMAATGSPCSR